jgi:peptidoglycan/xylan/chitin deacetylase (PgdA/CDA1 family)
MKNRRGIVHLMYHEIELPGRSVCHSEPGYVRYVVRDADFRMQIGWLQQNCWRGLSVSEALGFPEGRSVAITFDDGCETDLLVAAPLLKRARFAATFYITTGNLGKRGFLNLAQLRELSDLGFDIGCHSRTHPYLTDVPEEGLRDEISTVKDELEQLIGRPVLHFSCPGGRCDARVIAVAKGAGYHSVATSRTAPNFPGSDPFDLNRVAVMRNTTPGTFQHWCEGKALWTIQVQESARLAAQRLLGNSVYDRVRSVLLRG